MWLGDYVIIWLPEYLLIMWLCDYLIARIFADYVIMWLSDCSNICWLCDYVIIWLLRKSCWLCDYVIIGDHERWLLLIIADYLHTLTGFHVKTETPVPGRVWFGSQEKSQIGFDLAFTYLWGFLFDHWIQRFCRVLNNNFNSIGKYS